MSKRILILALVAMMLFATGCSRYEGPFSEKFVLKGVVTNVSSMLEIEVIESDYAYGVYCVHINEDTKIQNSEGKTISLSDIHPGDTVEITYNGQTMLSYPPQIVAHKVKLI